jgi:hypothetical protein
VPRSFCGLCRKGAGFDVRSVSFSFVIAQDEQNAVNRSLESAVMRKRIGHPAQSEFWYLSFFYTFCQFLSHPVARNVAH